MSAPRFTDQEWQTLELYVRAIADALELRDWSIDVSRDAPSSEEFIASCSCAQSRKNASIYFSDVFRHVDPIEQRQTVVHELLHAHHEVCWRMVQTDLLSPLGQETYGVFCDGYRRAMEYAVDAIAEALARHLPLIDWPQAETP